MTPSVTTAILGSPARRLQSFARLGSASEQCEPRLLLSGVADDQDDGTAPELQLSESTILGRNLATGMWTMSRHVGSEIINLEIGVWTPDKAWSYINTGDFNGDGRADLFGVDQYGELFVSLIDEAILDGDATLQVQSYGNWGTQVPWVDVRVGDFNGDQLDDIAVRNSRTGRWVVGGNTGDEQFSLAVAGTWPTSRTWVDVRVGDFNGDGFDDLIGRDLQYGRWMLAQSDGQPQPTFTYAYYAEWSSSVDWQDVTIVDLNHDGRDELLARNASAQVWWNTLSTDEAAITQSYGKYSNTAEWTDWSIIDTDSERPPMVLARHVASGWWFLGERIEDRLVVRRVSKWAQQVEWTDVSTVDLRGTGNYQVIGRNPITGAWVSSELIRPSIAAQTGLDYATSAKVAFRWDPTTLWNNVGSTDGLPPGGKAPGYAESIAPVDDDPDLSRVLIIGDSISIGYTLTVREELAGVANVHRPADNARMTTYGLEHLTEWITVNGNRRWDAIYFNFGLHDMVYVDENGIGTTPELGTFRTTPDQYQQNLMLIATLLQSTGATVIFGNTTPIPEGAPNRLPETVDIYNQAAAEVMAQLGIPIHDLNSFVAGHSMPLHITSDIHFTEYGSMELGKEVARYIGDALSQRP
ncbi:FG-GAP-like repeat-containing protein [Rubinisphaera margarita]|uniref:FG-GAP-like repeat-containing protein n=1 Tax=Rubinisphaera margarita TaxID=2909586 RepID=UPI001EE9030A|nr:FG-GAP-like repeat-containing protein [Rubinisphaera margarita]MCG6154785.1 FG-GAP-like repeat-containing protein [Rubinisphaera margarita]